MGNAQVTRDFREFGGIDVKANHITRDPRFCINAVNAFKTQSEDLTLRNGIKPIAWGGKNYDTWGVGGGPRYPSSLLISLLRQNNAAGPGVIAYEEQLLLLGETVFVLSECTLTITYAGAAPNTASFSFLPVYSGGAYYYELIIKENTTVKLQKNCGSLIDELGSFYDVATLVVDINAIAGGLFAATFSSPSIASTRMAAAHIPITPLTTITGIGVATTLVEETLWEFERAKEGIDTYSGELIENALGQMMNWASYEFPGIVSATVLQNRLLVASSNDARFAKYDGVSFFRAGLPCSQTLSGIIVAGPGITGDYTWSVTWEQIDSNNNTVEGDQSNDVDLTGLVNQKGRITFPAPGANYLRNHAYANNGGTETGSTLHVDDGAGGDHSLQSGQKVFFRDNAGTLQLANILDRTSTTIIIDGTYTIANNEPISAGLKLNLWRNQAGGITKYLVRTFAYHPGLPASTYDDATPDGSLGAEYVPPYEDLGHGELGAYSTLTGPNYPSFLTVFKNLLIAVTPHGTVHFSDPEGAEYFVGGGSSFTISSRTSDWVTGAAATREALFVFKPTEIHIIRGDLTNGAYTQERISGIGSDSHHSLQEVNGTIWFWSSRFGLNAINTSSLAQKLSHRITPILNAEDYDIDGGVLKKYVRSLYWPEENRYYLYLPVATTDGGTIVVDHENSITLVADTEDVDLLDYEVDLAGAVRETYPKLRWWKFSNINMFGGLAVWRGKLVWAQYRNEPTAGVQVLQLVQELDDQELTDYSDFAQPISFEYEHGWIYCDQPGTLKKWIRAELYSFRASLPVKAEFDVTVTLDIAYKDGSAYAQETITFDYDAATSVDEISKIFEFKPFVGKAIKLKFTGTYWCAAPVISGWSVEVVPDYGTHNRKA